MNVLVTIVIAGIATFGSMFGIYNYLPLKFFETNTPVTNRGNLGSTITTINGGDTLKDSRSVINTNFSNLNTDKFELSTWYSTTSAAQLTTLANLVTVGTLTSGSLGSGFTTVVVGRGGTNATSFTGSTLIASDNAGTTLLSTTTPFVTGITSTRATSTFATTTTLSVTTLSGVNGVRFTLPTADGTNAQVLQTNGSGVLSFTAAGSNAIASTTGQAFSAGDWVVAATTTNSAVNKSETSNAATINLGDTTNLRAGACYTNPSNGMLIRGVEFNLNKVSTPTDNLQVTVYPAISNNAASKYGIASSTLLDGSTLTGSAVFYRFSFATAIYQPPGETLCYVLSRSGAQDAVKYYQYGLNNSPTDGNLFQTIENPANSWSGNGNDVNIKILDDGQTAGRIYMASGMATNTATSSLGVITSTVATSGSASILPIGFANYWSGISGDYDFFIPWCYHCNPTRDMDVTQKFRGRTLSPNSAIIYR